MHSFQYSSWYNTRSYSSTSGGGSCFDFVGGFLCLCVIILYCYVSWYVLL